MRRLRILIVDDEKEFVDALVERLVLRDIRACGATSGREALECIQRDEFDVVLLDVMMPGLGGLEVIEEVKRRQPALPVVLLTGHGSAKNAERGMQAGAFECVMKPINIDELIDILRAASRDLQTLLNGSTQDIVRAYWPRLKSIAAKLKQADIPVCTTLNLDELIIQKLLHPETFLKRPS